MRVAFTTITTLISPYGHSEIADYEARIGPVFAEAERSPGFIDRARPVDDRYDLTNFERDWGVWGKFDAPKFYTGGRVTATDSRASTLSLWKNLDAIWTFAHGGKHLYMLANQKRWVKREDWKNYAAWWVDDDVIPTWSEACEKIHQINDLGSTSTAFDFRVPFDVCGEPYSMDKQFGPPIDEDI